MLFSLIPARVQVIVTGHTRKIYIIIIVFTIRQFPLTFVKPIAMEERQATDIASQFGNFPTTVPRFSPFGFAPFFFFFFPNFHFLFF